MHASKHDFCHEMFNTGDLSLHSALKKTHPKRNLKDGWLTSRIPRLSHTNALAWRLAWPTNSPRQYFTTSTINYLSPGIPDPRSPPLFFCMPKCSNYGSFHLLRELGREKALPAVKTPLVSRICAASGFYRKHAHLEPLGFFYTIAHITTATQMGT